MPEPVALPANPTNPPADTIWQTDPYSPPSSSYTNGTYSHEFVLTASGGSYPPSAPTPTVQPSSGSGSASIVGTPSTSQANVQVTVNNIVGSNLNLTIVLTYGDNAPK